MLAAVSLFLLAGCTSAPKPADHVVATKQPRWEYRYIDGPHPDHSPEAEKLKQAGWVFIGYNFRQDTIIMDGDPEAERRMYYGKVPSPVIAATFKREYDVARNK